MRIMFVVPSMTVGGAERHLTHLLRMLDRERFETSVVCISSPGALFDEVRAMGVEAVSLDTRMRQAPRAMLGLMRAVRRFRPHAIVTRGFNAEVLGRIAARLAGTPASVVWKHNCGDLHLRLRTRLADRLLDPVTDYYFGVAFGQIPYLVNERGYDGAKIRIIRNGVEPDSCARIADPRRRAEIAASLGLREGDVVVGILAVLRPEKDHATFLRAGRRIVDEVPRARLLIVGDGPERARLEALAAELGLGDRAVFAGMRSDVREVLSVVDVSVLSSFTIECFPFSILEAMSAGVPAVCTAVGGLPELVEHGVTGYLVPPRDPEGLARGVVRIIGREGVGAAMGAAARERLERLFTLEASVRETERAFAELLAPR